MLSRALRSAVLAAAALLVGARAEAGVAVGRSPGDDASCEIPSANPSAPAEWTHGDRTLPGLIATGRFEIRSAYRLTLCNVGLSVYVLQDVRDRRTVYECVSDDTYRAAFPCARLNSRP